MSDKANNTFTYQQVTLHYTYPAGHLRLMQTKIIGFGWKSRQKEKVDAVQKSLSSGAIKGPDNPTRQLLPIMSAKGCSRDGEGRKGKGGGEGSKS